MQNHLRTNWALILMLSGCVDSTKDDTGIEADWGTPSTYDDGGDPADGDVLDEGADTDTNADTGDTDGTDDGDTNDADGDGYSASAGDCDDNNAAIHPGAIEICNEIDDNCDEEVDNVEEGMTYTWYQDSDGDGFGNADLATLENANCEPPEGYAIASGDCDDTRSTIYPGAVEQCDGVDNDCDALIDDADPDLDMDEWYRDEDGDGYGDDSTEVSSCDPPEGYVGVGGDLDDSDPTITGDPFWTAKLLVEVSWEIEGDDMDLHLLAPGGELGSDLDCHYMNCKEETEAILDWGEEGETDDNPTLNLDDIEGSGPEVVSIPDPAPGTYTVVVHDYPSSPAMEEGNNVTIRIFVEGDLKVSDTRTISGEDVYKAVTEITVPDGGGIASITFTELDEELTPPSAGD